MGTYMIGELIRRTRENFGITCKELCDGICTIETLYRIENGERIPNRANFQALMERMGKSGEKYIPFICCDDLDIMKIGKELELLLSCRKYEEANKNLLYLKHRLGLEGSINRQFMLRMQALVDYESGKINIEEKREMLVAALECTVPGYREGILPKGLFTRTEIMLFCNIAVSYAQDKNFEMALGLFEQIVDYFNHTNIDIEERSISETLALSNYAQCLGQSGYTEKAIVIGKKAIDICLMTRKSGILPGLLYNLAFENEILHKNEEEYKKQFKQAYYVAELNGNENYLKHIEKHIENM